MTFLVSICCPCLSNTCNWLVPASDTWYRLSASTGNECQTWIKLTVYMMVYSWENFEFWRKKLAFLIRKLSWSAMYKLPSGVAVIEMGLCKDAFRAKSSSPPKHWHCCMAQLHFESTPTTIEVLPVYGSTRRIRFTKSWSVSAMNKAPSEMETVIEVGDTKLIFRASL